VKTTTDQVLANLALIQRDDGALKNGSVSYAFDSVGSRTQITSTLPAIASSRLLNYDANDRTATDPYDANGNLLNSGAGANVYDFENRLVQAGGVKPAHHPRLAAIPPGQHHHVARPLDEELVEGVGGEPDPGPPGGGALRAGVEALDERQEVVQLRPRGRVDEDLGRNRGVGRPQGQRRVEVAGLEEGQGVHGRSLAHWTPASGARRVLWPCFPMTGTGRALSRYLPAAALFVALIVAWQLAVTVLRVREYLLPAPLTVARAMMGDEIPWLRHLGITSLEIVGAFALAGAAGVALGVVVAWSPLLARALLPFLVFVNTLPKVAVAPLFLLWMGYGVLPNMLIGALIGFFPVVINTAVGLSQVDEELLDLGRVFNAPKWKVFAKIRIPNAYPYILSALKITATAAVVGAIVGEFVASQQGLGYVIVTTQGSMNTPVAFAALVWISLVGLAVYGLVVLAARRIAPWAETVE